MTAITAITSQNTTGVKSIIPVNSKEISNQIEFTAKDIKPDAVKIGMLHSKEVINSVIRSLKKIKAKKSEEPILKLEEEEPLILEQVHEEKKEKQKFEKQISPAARKLANETKIDINNVEGSGKMALFKRGYHEPNGSKPSPSERKLTWYRKRELR